MLARRVIAKIIDRWGRDHLVADLAGCKILVNGAKFAKFATKVYAARIMKILSGISNKSYKFIDKFC